MAWHRRKMSSISIDSVVQSHKHYRREVVNLVKVEVRNIQGIQYAKVEPKVAGATIIGGKNSAGKSSLLNSIAWTLGGDKLCPEHPIREGQDKAVCKVELSEDKERMFPPCTVIRTWKKNTKGEEVSSLQIKTLEGFTAPAPQTILDNIIGTLGFEPERFLRSNPKEQAKILRELVGLDFTGLDQEYKDLYEERTGINKRIEQLKARYEAMAFHPDAPEEPVSVAELMAELKVREAASKANRDVITAAEKANNSVANLTQKQSDAVAAVIDAERVLEEARSHLTQMQTDLAVAVEAAEQARVAVVGLVDPNEQEIQDKITASDETNRKQRENAAKAAIRADHTTAVQEADAATKRLDEIKEEKRVTTEAAKWPISGLGFDENGVLFNGRELSQASTTEQMKTAIAIRVALSPSLQFAILRDGSLLDEEQLAVVADFAAQMGTQLFIERVGRGGECDLVISDGRVDGQEEPPEEVAKVKVKKSKATELDE